MDAEVAHAARSDSARLPAASLDDAVRALLANDPTAMSDPWPLFATLRERGPAYRHGPVVLVTRHAEARAALRDDASLSSRTYLGSRAEEALGRMTEPQRQAYAAVSAFEAMFMSRSDAEPHARVRRVVQRVFTPRRIADLRAAVQRYADELLADLPSDEVVDLMPFAYRLPLMVIADMLEVPHADRELIHGWSSTIGASRRGVDPDALMPAHAAIVEFGDYVEEMVRERRRSPRASDLAALLLDAEQGEVLTSAELVAQFVVLLFAGHETTTNLIGTGLLELLRRPDQWRSLCREPASAPAAVEELLRFVSPVQWAWRVAVEEYREGDVSIAEGTTVAVLIAAANRDPRVFERPDELDLVRPDARHHLALGHGVHVCLGAALARLEGEVAFRTLAERFPGLELADGALAWRGNAMLRALHALPVRLAPT